MSMRTSHAETERFFQRLFSFAERSYTTTRSQLMRISHMESGPRGREFCRFSTPHLSAHGVEELDAGGFYTPSVAELREELGEVLQQFEKDRPGYVALLRGKYPRHASLTLSHEVGDAASLHTASPGALFQAASQFNLLEFPEPSCTPEMGIGPYVFDPTQGPACAVSCAAGTAYRCYVMAARFVRGDDSTETEPRGQTEHFQADMLRGITHAITGGMHTGLPSLPYNAFYTVRNGYFASTDAQMRDLLTRIEAIAKAREMSRDALMLELSTLLRVGVVENTDVTSPLHVRGGDSLLLHKVTQTYNSALSLHQSYPSDSPWAAFARMVLIGTYEATLLCGALHTLRAAQKVPMKNPLPPALPPIYLTKVGGGVFHNDASWIRQALDFARQKVAMYNVPLDLRLVHFKTIDESYVQ